MALCHQWGTTRIHSGTSTFPDIYDIVNKILKFADDTKLVGAVTNNLDAQKLRSDLKKLYDWSVDWQMLFNVEKCKVIHFGYNNKQHNYFLGEECIQAELEEIKDLIGCYYKAARS